MSEKRWIVMAVALAGANSAAAWAHEIEVIGTGTVNIHAGTPNDVRIKALRAAKRRAVEMAIDKILGPDANLNPKVAPKIAAIVSQIPESSIVAQKSSRSGDNYELSVTLVLDDKRFRTLLSDSGVAINASRARGHALLAVMDEFLTAPREIQAKVEDLVEFKRDAGAVSHDASHSREASRSVEVSASAPVHANQRAVDASRSSSASVSAAASEDVKDIGAEQHDRIDYRHLVRYQPQGSPEKTSQTYNALMGQLQDFDLRVLDNDVFRSAYFKDRPLTIEALQNGEQLAKYVSFAKTEAHADFFMVGTSIIIDSGVNPATGESNCSGVVTVKTYSTVDGESIASETDAETAAGRNVNDCAGNVSRKLARICGASIGARIHDYHKRRSTYGGEYVMTLDGVSLSLLQRLMFLRTVKGVPGVENVVQRSSTEKQVELVVTYSGTDPIDQAVAMSLLTMPAFATLDARMEGSKIRLCMGPCGAFAKPVNKEGE